MSTPITRPTRRSRPGCAGASLALMTASPPMPTTSTPTSRCRKLADATFVVTISEFNRRWLADPDNGPDQTPVEVVHCGVYLIEIRSMPSAARAGAGDGDASPACRSTRDTNFPPAWRAIDGSTGSDSSWSARASGAQPRTARVGASTLPPGEVHGGSGGGRGPRALCPGRSVGAPSVVAGGRSDGRTAGRADRGDGERASGCSGRACRGLPELVVDGETGLLPPGDPGALAGVLALILASPEAGAVRRERPSGRRGRTSRPATPGRGWRGAAQPGWRQTSAGSERGLLPRPPNPSLNSVSARRRPASPSRVASSGIGDKNLGQASLAIRRRRRGRPPVSPSITVREARRRRWRPPPAPSSSPGGLPHSASWRCTGSRPPARRRTAPVPRRFRYSDR